MRTLPETSLRMGMGMMNLLRGLASAVAVVVLSFVLEDRQLYHMQLLAQEQSQHMLAVQPMLDRLQALFHAWGDRSEMAGYKAMPQNRPLPRRSCCTSWVCFAAWRCHSPRSLC